MKYFEMTQKLVEKMVHFVMLFLFLIFFFDERTKERGRGERGKGKWISYNTK